jgi:hypothetical protein
MLNLFQHLRKGIIRGVIANKIRQLFLRLSFKFKEVLAIEENFAT